MTKFLRIAQWNANGLVQHKEEIILFLKENFIDILLISKSHFTTESYMNIPTKCIIQIFQTELHTVVLLSSSNSQLNIISCQN